MKLEEAKPGMHVLYVPHHAQGDRGHEDCEDGIVSSVNDHFVFVKFRLNQVNGQACDPETLVRLA